MTYIRDHAVKPHCTHRGTVDFRFSLLPLPLGIVQHMYYTMYNKNYELAFNFLSPQAPS